MKSLRGKKLLCLGGAANEITLVERAKELGVYTIVADSNTDRTLSPAKNIADEVWDVSWSDLDTLEKYCRKAHVDGVVAGYSEFRVENQIKLCQRLELSCCTTLEQLEVTRNKDKFKNVCRRNGVPVVHDYANPAEVDHFPVILKPVDRAGSIGISVANNPEELKTAYQYAMDCSVCKKVIIEDFITDGIKVDVYYGVCNGEIYYLSSSDVIFAAENGTEKVVQSAWLFPSRYEKQYLEEVDSSVRTMIRNLDIQNGYMFFSTFWTPRGFVMFEMGLRLCGGHTYAFLPLEGKLNNQDLYIYHALTGDVKELCYDTENTRQLYTAIVNVYAKKGVVGQISGFEGIKEQPHCRLVVQQGAVGHVCAEDKAILSKMGLATFSVVEPAQLEEEVRDMYSKLSVTDQQGRDMVYDRVNPQVIADWWKNCSFK